MGPSAHASLVCPKCREPKAALTNPPDAAVMMFRCGFCAFEWASVSPILIRPKPATNAG